MDGTRPEQRGRTSVSVEQSCAWRGDSRGEDGATGAPEAQGVACGEKMHSLPPLLPDHACVEHLNEHLRRRHSMCKPQSVRARAGRLEAMACHFDIISGDGYLSEK